MNDVSSPTEAGQHPAKPLRAREKMDPRFEAALARVDRQVFLNNRTEGLVVGRSIPSTENLRRTLAIVTLLPSGPNVLHVGAGLGYASVVLAQVARKVVAIEINALLARAIATNIEQLGVGNVVLRHGDGSGGAPDFAPFDLILVASPSIEQKSALLSQLSPRGQLVCVEWGEASLLTLVKYTHDGRHHYVRSEHGYMDFVPNRDEILIELGLVSDELLVRARQLAKTNKTTIIDEVRKLNNLNDMELYRSLARQYGLQLGEVEQLLRKVDPKYFGACSKAFLDHQHLIPLYPEGGSLKVATDNPTASMVEIQKVFPKEKIGKILVTPTDFRRLWSAIDLCQPHYQPAPNTEEQSETAEAENFVDAVKPEVEAHLVSVFEALLLDAVAERASDIHIEQYRGVGRVRLRVDGELRDLNHYVLDSEELKGLVNVIKIRAELNIAERRLPQGGRSVLRVGSLMYDLRIHVQPSLHGEHVIIRLLPQNSELISIARLGMSPTIGESYQRLLRDPAGLVLVVGPTGSGKSTTLYAGLQLLAEDATRKVITVEDPIEYSIDNIQQTRVRPEIGFHFTDAMRSFVRQDPDVILVGEIRDYETALEAIRASQTGHVVLSTLHCNDAVDAMQRLYDLGVHPNSLASELLAVIAQRLARRICPHCRVEAESDPEILKEVFPDGTPDSFVAYVGKGCDQCGGRGVHGRVAVVEYMRANADLRNAISRQIPVAELRKLALDCGLVTMRDSALDHVIQGNIPLSELPRILPAERMAPEARWQWEATE